MGCVCSRASAAVEPEALLVESRRRGGDDEVASPLDKDKELSATSSPHSSTPHAATVLSTPLLSVCAPPLAASARRASASGVSATAREAPLGGGTPGTFPTAHEDGGGSDAAAIRTSSSLAPDDDAAAVWQFMLEIWKARAHDALVMLLAAPPPIRRHFEAFLASEYNSNHVEFYLEVQRLTALHDADEINAHAQKIYRRYVQRGSEEEVNLSHRLRSWEFNARDHITMLKAAQAEVLQMLALDPFPRFLRSPQCTAMLDTLTHNTSLCWAPLWTHTSSGPPSSHPGSGFLGYDSLSPAGTEACTAMGAGVCAASTASLERRVNPGGGATCSPHATAMPLTAVREVDADDARSSHCAGSGLLDGESSPVLPVPVGSDRAALEHPIHSAKFLETLQAARQGMESEAGHWLDVFESVAALIPYGIVVSDMRKPHARVKYANPAFSSITGYSLKDVMGKSWSFLKSPATEASAIADIGAAIAEGRSLQLQLTSMKKDGSTYKNWLCMHPVLELPRGEQQADVACCAIAESRVVVSMPPAATAVLVSDKQLPSQRSVRYRAFTPSTTVEGLSSSDGTLSGRSTVRSGNSTIAPGTSVALSKTCSTALPSSTSFPSRLGGASHPSQHVASVDYLVDEEEARASTHDATAAAMSDGMLDVPYPTGVPSTFSALGRLPSADVADTPSVSAASAHAVGPSAVAFGVCAGPHAAVAHSSCARDEVEAASTSGALPAHTTDGEVGSSTITLGSILDQPPASKHDRPAVAYYIAIFFEVDDESLVSSNLMRHAALLHMLPKYITL